MFYKAGIFLNAKVKMFMCVCVCCSKHAVAMVHSVPVLKVEEWPLPGDSLTSDTVRALIDRVSSYSVHIYIHLFWVLHLMLT